MDVGERVGVEQDQVGQLSRLHRPERVQGLEVAGRLVGRGPERIHRRDAAGHEEGQLVVQAEAAKHADAGRVGPGHEGYARPVQDAQELHPLGEDPPADLRGGRGQVGREAHHHLLEPPEVRRAVAIGGVGRLHRVGQEGQRLHDHQGGHHPGAVGRQMPKGRHRIGVGAGADELLHRMRRGQAGPLFGGAHAREPEEVLEAPLSGIGRLHDRDRVGQVSGEGQPAPLDLVGDREICGPGEPVVDLDEVHPQARRASRPRHGRSRGW